MYLQNIMIFGTYKVHNKATNEMVLTFVILCQLLFARGRFVPPFLICSNNYTICNFT